VKLLIASKNDGKCREIQSALEGLGLEFATLRDFPDVPSAPEEGASYEENALEKSRYYTGLTGVPALADDSGLEIGHLAGKPGVRSARFVGSTASYTQKNEAVLNLLKGVPTAKRGARFVCAVAYVDAQGDSYVVRAECKGRIAESIRGDYGFGYDPIFVPEGSDQTFGELGQNVKSRISHRAKALCKARAFFLQGRSESNGNGDGEDAMSVCKIVRADAASPSPEIVVEAAESICAGKLIAYPTDTLYGLGANALDTASASKLIEAKKRPSGKPISVIVGSVDQARALAKNPDAVWERLVETFWPGPLTTVVDAAGDVPAMLTGGTGKIGMRVPDCPLARAISERAEVPVTATSANVAGRAPATTAGEIVAALGDHLSLVLDCGTLDADRGSTVVDVTSGKVRVIRKGVVAEERIEEVLGESALEGLS
jgi:XTP/dITP diphosphohydrolase